MRSIVRVLSISPRPQFNNFSRDTVPLSTVTETLPSTSKKYLQNVPILKAWLYPSSVIALCDSRISAQRQTRIRRIQWLFNSFVKGQCHKSIVAMDSMSGNMCDFCSEATFFKNSPVWEEVSQEKVFKNCVLHISSFQVLKVCLS